MSVLHSLRAYHAALALLALGAYVTSEVGLIHPWLGYGVVAVILIRLLMALSGNRALGLTKFRPRFEGLKPTNLHTHPAVGRALVFGIALSLVGVTATGMLMDKGRALGLGTAETTVTATTTNEDGEREHRHERKHEESALEEVHETFGNALMFLVAAHVGYVLLFKFPMARFMLFLTPAKKRGQA